MKLAWLCLSLALLSACWLGCGQHAAGAEGRTQAGSENSRAAVPQRPHIVLYLVDTLRADHLSSYGYAKATSPFVDSLVGDSALFENAIAQGPWTVPSVTSLMTSTYTSVHGMVDIEQKVPESTVTLPEMLRDAGYDTFGFTQSPFSGAITGLDQGYRVLVEKPLDPMSPDQLAQGVDSLKPFFSWIENWEPNAPSFIFIHTGEPHWPLRDLNPRIFSKDDARRAHEINAYFRRFRELSRHRPSRDPGSEGHLAYRADLAQVKEKLAERREEIVDLYDKAVQVADANLRQVVEALQAKGVWENSVFALISDHGEELLDHGYWLHDQSLHDELIRVPLLLRIPGVTDGGRRLSSPVELIDLGPTLAELAGSTVPEAWQGKSILAQAAAEPGAENRRAFSERINTRKYDRRISEDRGNRETAVVEGNWKLVHHHDVDLTSLFDRSQDPGEQRDLSQARPDVVEKLYGQIELWRKGLAAGASGSARDVELGPEQLEALRILGYVDDPGGQPEPSPSP